jgi:hypothetical protein
MNVMGKPLLVESREGSDRGFYVEISQHSHCGTEKTLYVRIAGILYEFVLGTIRI